ncbi:MAG: hypothetical protein DYG89_04030 [Caldilinea sp. CFX5]|nr:hypothetical protein [Caldilinea sp. CFX5]
METAFYNTYAIPTQAEACAVAERWGKEDALAGLDNNAATYYTPDSPEWHAYEIGYLQSKRQIVQTAPLRPTGAHVSTLPPSLVMLRGYETAFFKRPICAALPSQPAERCDYLRGYAKGTALQRQILSAAPASHSPGLWALRGYEDALFERPIRPGLPNQFTDCYDYLIGYAEGAAMLQKILAAPPPLAPVDDDQPIFYFKETEQ